MIPMSRIHLISGPRNISTALMYAFGNRADMSVVDEPFYAHYLDSHPDIMHPGRDEILAAMSTDYQHIVDTSISADYETPHVFFKNMAHHLDGTDWSFLSEVQNVFLIRDPAQLIASFAQVISEPTLLDIGLGLEWDLFSHVRSLGHAPIVIDSGEVLANPADQLSRLCDRLDIPFDEAMLTWTPGPRAEDGVWAPYWYANVHASSGWERQPTSKRPFPERLRPLWEEAMVYNERLSAWV